MAMGLKPKPAIAKGIESIIDPGAAKIVDVVDGQRSLVNGRGEDDDGVGVVAQVF
jgi:hypothetical protein